MPTLPAARVGDDIAHTNAGIGMLRGVLIGAAVGAVLIGATVATGGLALVAATGAAMGAVSAGGLGGMYIGEASMGPACGKFTVGSPDVFINGRPATFTLGSTASCQKDGIVPLASGAATVTINFGLAGREKEKLGCSALSIARTSPNVFIGGPSAQDPRVEIQPEVPVWAVTTLQVLGVAGAILALPYSIVALGVAGTIGTGVLGTLGAMGLSMGARQLGEAMGLSESTIRAMEVGGGVLGGALAGGPAARYSARRWGAPPETMAALNRMPLNYQRQYATAKATGWRWPNKGWPYNNGAVGPKTIRPLPDKTPLDRFGPETGGFMSPAGDTFPMRAMRPGGDAAPANPYTSKPGLMVEEAEIAPWFDQPGGGKQYRLIDPSGKEPRYNVEMAIRDGYLRRGH